MENYAMPDNTTRTQELLAQEGLENISQKLHNAINIELSGNPKTARKWIWELLQNAKDVISSKGRIEITLDADSVVFAHNGNPFQHSQLLALLSQRSTKAPSYTDDEKKNFFDKLLQNEEIDGADARKFLNTTGRFGTGFMTTYLLSKKIYLEGVFAEDGHHKALSIPLDRDAQTPDQMKEKVKESFDSFAIIEKSSSTDRIIINYSVGDNCDTKFIYRFDEEGKSIAEQGIADLHNTIAFTLAFVDKIDSVKITEYGQTTLYRRVSHSKIEDIEIIKIEKNSPELRSEIEIARLSDLHNAVSIAVQIMKVDDNRYGIIKPNEKTPRQFISFPLIGSESFSFPVIINSPLFNLDDTRSHVFLRISSSSIFDKKVLLNRALFERSVLLYKKLLTQSSNQKWENLHYLAISDIPKDIDGDWYRDSIQKPIREKILATKLVVTEDGNRIEPANAKFPVFKKTRLEDFWELCKHLVGDKIPRKEDVEVWKTIIEANSNNWLDIDFEFSLEKLLGTIEGNESFIGFNSKYFNNEEIAFGVLNQIIQFTEDEDADLLNRKENPYMVFPDQTSQSAFKSKRELSRDMGIPKFLKDVLKETGDDWYSKLVRNEIIRFEKEAKLTIKDVSNKLNEKIENHYSKKLSDIEVQQLIKGLFLMAGYTDDINKIHIEKLHKFLKGLYPDAISDGIDVVTNVIEFDWNSIQRWYLHKTLSKVSSLSNLRALAQHWFKKNYPDIKDHYSEDEEDIIFRVDTALNEIIQFAAAFDKSLLSKYNIIPNQLNQLTKLNHEIFNDASIPKELKIIMKDFGHECRGSLLHTGVSLIIENEPRDLKWICGQLDDIAIKEQDNPNFKQPLRELDKWISRKKGTISGMDELFKTFYRKRSGIVLNTYDLDERNQFDEILKSGLITEMAGIVKSGASIEAIKKVTSVIEKYPDLTLERIEKLLELEKLSEGWNPELKYTPSEEQIRINFINGWKGEAYVFQVLVNKGYNVDWRNKSSVVTENKIIDYTGEEHYIMDKSEKYDIIVKHSSGRTIYIQVKTTTTDISDADQIALPISTREWNFVFETNENDTYFLARVFNILKTPSVYFMNLQKSPML